MPLGVSPDPLAVERAAMLARLGLTDNPSLTLATLRDMGGDGADTAKAVKASSQTSGGTSVSGGLDIDVRSAPYNAGGAGVTDDTAAINAAIVANPGHTIRLSVGPLGQNTYLVNPTANSGPGTPVGIQLNQAKTRILLDPGVTIQATTNTSTNYAIIQATASDCIVEGGRIKGDIDSRTAWTGEWGHGIIADAGSDRLKVKNVEITKCFGDGVCIQGTPSNIELHYLDSHDNRRQGLSVVSVDGLRIYGGRYRDTGITRSTAPSAGIDIEPDNGNEICRDIEAYAVSLTGNVGSGVQILAIPGATAEQGRVKFIGGVSSHNIGAGVAFVNNNGIPDNVTFEAFTAEYNQSFGYDVEGNASNLRIIGGRYNKNGIRGICIIPGTGRTVTNVLILGVQTLDNSQTTPNTADGIRADGNVNGFKVAFCRSGGTSQHFGLTTGPTVVGEFYVGNDFSGNGTGATVLGGDATTRVNLDLKPTVTGSRGGNAALASMLTGLASAGILVDSSTA